jgi:MYXO-CTERM domain-containing protein
VCSAFAVPETARRIRYEPEAARAYAAAYVYPALGDASDRAANLGRGIVRQFPAPRPLVEAVGVDADHWCGAATWACGRFVLLADEDYAGNPAHVLGALVLGAAATLRRRRLPGRARIALVATAAAWVLFHLVFRDNFWTARLELPIFVLSGLGLAALGGRTPRRRWIEIATAAAAMLALANATAVAARNPRRPPFANAGGDPVDAYYPGHPKMRRAHDLVLDTARRLDCRRLGIVTGQDSHEYQLTWRAVQAGIEVRHVFGRDAWPCLIFVVEAPAPPLDPLAWRPLAWARNAAFLFASTPRSTTSAASRE